MRFNSVGRQANELDATLLELWLKLGEGTKLRRADWSIVLRVGEEYYPVVADELVEVDVSGGGLSIEIWGNGAEA
jgi:hypothetical protein